MSIVYTADVFCDGIRQDGEPCGQWTNGVTGDEPPRKMLARERAAQERWTHCGGRDYCPRCAKARLAKATENI